MDSNCSGEAAATHGTSAKAVAMSSSLSLSNAACANARRTSAVSALPAGHVRAMCASAARVAEGEFRLALTAASLGTRSKHRAACRANRVWANDSTSSAALPASASGATRDASHSTTSILSPTSGNPSRMALSNAHSPSATAESACASRVAHTALRNACKLRASAVSACRRSSIFRVARARFVVMCQAAPASHFPILSLRDRCTLD